MFTAAGTFKCEIDDIKFAEPKFAKGENDFDICLHVTSVDDINQSDWWHGEMSQNYGKGNFAGMMQTEITMQSLHKVGFDGDDLTTIKEQMMGKVIPVTTKEAVGKDGKEYYNIWFIGGGGSEPVELDPAALKARLAALTGGGSSSRAPAKDDDNLDLTPAKAADNPFK